MTLFYTNRIQAVCLVCLLVLLCGCNSMEKRKYGLIGPAVGEKVDTFEDFWTDCGPFKPNDPSMKMRRGKAGVVRFFKKGNYTHSVRVEGSFIVYVFHGSEDGVELTQPQAKLVLSAEQLEKQRKFDKKVGHSYHVWLDLGDVDQPEEEISLLSIFTDTKTGEQTSSKVVRTIVPGTPVAKTAADEKDSVEEIRRRLFKKHEEELKQRAEYVRTGDTQRKEVDSSPGSGHDHSRTSSEQIKNDSVQVDRRVTTIDVSSMSRRLATAESVMNPISSAACDTANDPSRERLLATIRAGRNNDSAPFRQTSGVLPRGKQKYTLEEARHLGSPFTPEWSQTALAPGTPMAIAQTVAGPAPQIETLSNDRGKPAVAPAAFPQARSIDSQSGQPRAPEQEHSQANWPDPLSEFVPEESDSRTKTQVLLGPVKDQAVSPGF